MLRHAPLKDRGKCGDSVRRYGLDWLIAIDAMHDAALLEERQQWLGLFFV
jgi:hypothetical protein